MFHINDLRNNVNLVLHESIHLGIVPSSLTGTNTHTKQHVMYIKPTKVLSREEIHNIIKEAHDPFIAVLGKRHSEVNPEEDMPEMIRIHNATVAAVEDLHQRVAALEAMLNAKKA